MNPFLCHYQSLKRSQVWQNFNIQVWDFNKDNYPIQCIASSSNHVEKKNTKLFIDVLCLNFDSKMPLKQKQWHVVTLSDAIIARMHVRDIYRANIIEGTVSPVGILKRTNNQKTGLCVNISR